MLKGVKKKVLEGFSFEPVTIYPSVVERVMNTARDDGKWVVGVVTATKPDFYKQWSLVPASEKLDMPVFIINTGQHYDDLLGRGLDEFGLDDYFACDLAVRGDLLQKTGEIVLKMGFFARYLKKNWPGVTVLPIVHGDTLAAGISPIGWQFAVNERAGQNEAGLRGMAPEKKTMRKLVRGKLPPEEFVEAQWRGEWEVVRNEPFPEQWDTFVAGAGSEYLFAPCEINKKHLLREGCAEDRVFLVGNSIVDAINMKRKEKPEKSVFEEYPRLDKESDWIRVDIHRRGNLTPERFKAVISGVRELAEKGKNIVFIEMNATKKAIKHYGLEKKLDHPNIYKTPLWPMYGHVVEFLESGKCFAELTDSGSMQEELNEIKETLCLTVRYNTDRPESVLAKSNLLVPPASPELVVDMVEHVYGSQEICKAMRKSPRIYGENVGEKIVAVIKKASEAGEHPFRWAHELYGESEKSRLTYL